jgi:rod shape-determining protein MreC
MASWWGRYRWERLLLGLFFALLLGWLLVPAFLRHRLRAVLQELQAPVWYAMAGGRDLLNREVLLAQSKETLARLVVELSRTNANERLARRVQGEGPGTEGPPGTVGNFAVHQLRVLRRDGKAWWQELLLSRGKDLRENLPLVCGEFLAGKILHVHASHCVALLASDPRFHAVAHVAGDRRPVIYEGVAQGGFGQPIGRVTHLPQELGDGRPLVIVTSSLSGVYPDGVPIGPVDNLQPSADGLFLEGTVHLCPQLLQARELGVLVPVGDFISH